jgi:hypothetical protein
MIDLNLWHHAIHQVSGGMALRFNRATPADLVKWAGMLRAIAGEMEARVTSREAAAESESREKTAVPA